MIFLSSPLGGRPIRFDKTIFVKNLREISSYDAKLMPFFGDGESKDCLMHRIASIEQIQTSVSREPWRGNHCLRAMHAGQ